MCVLIKKVTTNNINMQVLGCALMILGGLACVVFGFIAFFSTSNSKLSSNNSTLVSSTATPLEHDKTAVLIGFLVAGLIMMLLAYVQFYLGVVVAARSRNLIRDELRPVPPLPTGYVTPIHDDIVEIEAARLARN